MPIGFLRSAPKVDISFDRDSYVPGDELRVRVTVRTDRPGASVRRAMVELMQEVRYTRSGMVNVPDIGSARGNAAGGNVRAIGGGRGVSNSKRVTEERVERVSVSRERLFADGVIRHRNESFDLRFQIKPAASGRISKQGSSYLISVHFDMPRMRDVEIHRAVPVKLA